MKIRAMVLSCLISAVVLFMGYEYSRAGAKADKSTLEIAVISVQKIFKDCKKSAGYRQEAAAERRRIEANLEKLSKEIEAEEAGLETLKAGSSDYMAQVKEIFQKRASLRADTEYYNREMALKERGMVEALYEDILREIGEVARQKDLDLVFERSEPELSALSPQELDDTISTHKLLYSGDCLDITDEVMARVDAKK